MKHLLCTGVCAFCTTTFIIAQNPVPNPGFENWASGNPVSWSTTNIPGVAVPVTQTTPPYTGTYAAKGEVVNFMGNPFAPFLSSTDMSGNGFPVSYPYGTFSFYYKFNQIGTTYLTALAAMSDINSMLVAAAGNSYSVPVASFTLASIPFYYVGGNPSEAVISFSISDSSGTAAIGNYFVVDEVTFSGTVGIEESKTPGLEILKINPNPVSSNAFIYYSIPVRSDIRFELMDVTGRKHHEIFIAGEIAGQHKIEFNSSAIPSGFYLLVMNAESGFSTLPVLIAH